MVLATRPLIDAATRFPITTLTCFFIAWKLILLLIAFLSPGTGYDTSTSLQIHIADSSDLASSPTKLLTSLSGWDALYFLSIARRGYLYEQEWAFGAGFARSVFFANNGQVLRANLVADWTLEWTGVVIAHVSHFLSTIVLHRLCLLVFDKHSNSKYALVVALLHITAPAGLFLSAPFAESSFSLLSFTGLWLYLFGIKARASSNDLCLAVSGIFFGIASTFRSNGILNGILYVFDLVTSRPSFSTPDLRRRGALLLGGALTFCLSSLPQVSAWFEYCFKETSEQRRPWCGHFPPSIYAFVQSHYWGVGFLKYWTISNIPLFLIASPMIVLMLCSAIPHLVKAWQNRPGPSNPSCRNGKERQELVQDYATSSLLRLALPQLVMTMLCLTNFHVQIINRVSAGYVLPYIFVADAVFDEDKHRGGSRPIFHPQAWIRLTVMYALVQGGLFASFLPPA